MRFRNTIIFSFSLTGILFVAALTFVVNTLFSPLRCSETHEYLDIPEDSNARKVAEILVNNRCITQESAFLLAIRFAFKDKEIKPGRYHMTGISSMYDLINLLTKPNISTTKVRILEGWELTQIAAELAKKLDISETHFTALCRSYDFIQTFNIDSHSLEGFLFPDTYYFLSNYQEEDVISVMVEQFKKIYFSEVKPVADSLGWSMREVATLASIIQGEARYSREMPKISSVYHNRLRRKMRLQADPTIQYVIPGKNRRVYYKDLKIDSPYNTYKYKGLPPGPINSPGLSALMAAVRPLQTEYLFFVADINGMHVFSKSNREHNSVRRQVKRRWRNLRNK